jgi:hypothetical protein
MKTKMTLLALCAPLLALAADMDQDVIVLDTPYWEAGAAYSADFNLSNQQLTLLPLSGVDLQVDAKSNCASTTGIDEGVYSLVKADDGYQLHASYPEGGRVEFDQGDVVLDSCDDANASNVRLAMPAYALALLDSYHVGAIYLHR